MRRKGIFTLLTAVFMVLAFSAVTFAANQIVLKTTVPNIPKSVCYQAGTDTMEIDSLTQMREGDVIQFTLNNKVTVCKSLNMWLRIAPVGGALTTSADSPVAATGGSVNGVGTGEWGFLIRATNADTAAGQIITLTLRLRDAATSTLAAIPASPNVMTYTGAALTDKMVVKLFDGKTVFAGSGFFKQAATPVANVYDTNIVAADNALCIDTLTQDYLEEYVQNTPDSILYATADTKMNFSGDYRIAHIMAEQTYNLYTCKGAVAGNIVMGTTSQSGCTAFDFETAYSATANGYCIDHVGSNRFLLQSSQPFENTGYTMTMEILVNGVAGDHGVYFSGGAINTLASSTFGAACSSAATATNALTVSAYLRADGATTATPIAMSGCSSVLDANKAVKIITSSNNLGIAASSLFVWVDFPAFNYNLAEVKAGDVVSVKVTLAKSTCGSVGTWTIPVGTFGCTYVSSGVLLFPYFTSLTTDAFWNGIAIINTGSTAGTANFTAYEKDGSVGSVASVAVPAKGMYVNLLESMPWVGTDLGGSQCYIQVSSDFAADGFGMIAKPGTGESMGYLPRKPSTP